MTTYTTITNAEVDQDSPLTQPLVTALRDNPIAISEQDASALIDASVWHPYDKVTVGDANIGELYDFGTDGSVASVETPDFADGWEYKIFTYGLSADASASFRVGLYRATDLAYVNTNITTLQVAGIVHNNISVEILIPRLSRRYVDVEIMGASTHISNVGYNEVDLTNSQKVGKAQIAPSTGNIDAGAIYLFRRRCYFTS